MFDMLGKADAVFVTSNGFVNSTGLATMGRGCAAEAVELMNKRGINLKSVMGKVLKTHGNVVNGLVKVDCTLMFSFPVKAVSETALDNLSNVVPHMRARMTPGKMVPGWACMARPELVERSAHQAMKVADILQLNNLIIPRPGCGAGGLDWKNIGPMLHDILDDRFISMSWGSYVKTTGTGKGSVIVRNKKTYDGPGVYIGRNMPGQPGHPLGNPFKVGPISREESIDRYKKLFYGAWVYDDTKKNALASLRKMYDNGEDINLICWCAPEACHGDIIKEWLEYTSPPDPPVGQAVYVGDVQLAEKHTRIVHGGRGDYMEIEPADMCINNLSIPSGQEYRLTSDKVYFDWYECNNAMVYKQKRTVGYADYKVTKFYIDPRLVRLV